MCIAHLLEAARVETARPGTVRANAARTHEAGATQGLGTLAVRGQYTQPMAHPLAFRYRVVDVFTQRALEGNPLAVFPDASGIDSAWMPRIAKELNLSETVFVLPSSREGCARRLRIFTPAGELPFAGHPTVGSGFVLRDEGVIPAGQDRFLLDEKIGAIAVRVEAGERPLIWLRTPRIEYGQRYDPAACAEALGVERSELLEVEPQVVSAGNPMLFVPLRRREAVDRAFLDMQGLRRIRGTDQDPGAVFVFAPTAEGAYSRMFGPEHGVVEDPATGSATGPLASLMLRHGLVAPALGQRFISEQGTKMGRRSILHIQVSREGGEEVIEVGGYVTPLIEATMDLSGLA